MPPGGAAPKLESFWSRGTKLSKDARKHFVSKKSWNRKFIKNSFKGSPGSFFNNLLDLEGLSFEGSPGSFFNNLLDLEGLSFEGSPGSFFNNLLDLEGLRGAKVVRREVFYPACQGDGPHA